MADSGYEDIGTWDYSYDANSNVLSAIQGGSVGAYVKADRLYTYDTADRLITAQLDEEQDWTVDSGYNGTSWYQMDDVGNRESHRYRYNAGGGPTAYDMTYDQANRMTAIDGQGQSYDAAGNQLTGHSVNRDLAYVYHYDHHNRLTSVFDSTDTTRKAAFTWDALGRRIAHINDALGITTRYFFDGVNELVEYADNGTGNGLRSRYYVHGVSYVDERLMMYDDDTDRPYYYVTDRMHNVRVLVDRAGAIRERYAYDPYGRPLTCPLCPPRRMSRVRELCGRGDMNNDTRMTTTPDDTRFSAAKAGVLDSPLRPKDAGSRCDPSRRATGRRVKEDPRADLDDDGDVDGDDETAYHNKKPTWSSVMSAPTVSQAFSDFDNPYMFQGVPHFALDTAANRDLAYVYHYW
jgi:YD repeat-containing protein